MSNNITTFTSHDNIELLWEIIIEDKTITHIIELNDIKLKMREYYDCVLNEYMFTHSLSNNLLQVNKDFLSYFMNKLKNENITRDVKQLKKIDISEDETTLPTQDIITIEELHNKRRDNFNIILKQKQNEFNEFNRVSIPEKPEFNDNIKETNNDDIESLITKAIADRQLELVSQIDKNKCA